MVCSQVVDLFLEDAGPEVLAHELHQVELVLEFWVLSGKLLDQAISGVEANVFKISKTFFFFRRTGNTTEHV